MTELLQPVSYPRVAGEGVFFRFNNLRLLAFHEKAFRLWVL